MTYRYYDFYIPERMMDHIEAYIMEGTPVGGFLSAVICNDLSNAVGRADDENLRNLPAFVGYFYNKAPSECWGSKEKMQAWIGSKYLARKEAELEASNDRTSMG